MEENKYQKGKIYKIVDNAYNMCYYGSTINMLSQRMSLHRESYIKKKAYYTAFDIFDTYGLENCKIELVENFPCNSRNELDAREGFYIKNNECVNKCIAGRTPKEYKQDNKEKIKKINKEYYENNKENISIKYKEYRDKYTEINKDKIIEYKNKYYKDNKNEIKEQKKQYSEANKDKIREQRKQYREANKDKIKEQKRLAYLKKKASPQNII
jgi:adenylate kinase family enzyme